MSGHKYTDSSNLFFEEDEVDDELFLRNSRRLNNGQNPFDEQRQTFVERRKEIEDRAIQSTERSITLLRDSEQVGIATAEELMRQREQLERTDKRLDEINQTLRFSQKHINGIKSVFSSLKNYMSGKNDQNSPVSSGSSSSAQPNQPTSNLQDSIPEYDRYENHPTTRLRNTEPSTIPSQTQASGSKNFSAKLDANLQEMHSSISKLKGLATDLTYEIDSQNDLIGTITDKTEKADLTLTKQNKDINRLLKK